MANKLERLLFTRKRLANDIVHQTAKIGTLTDGSSSAILISRKEALEELWAKFKGNQEVIEHSQSWVGTDEFIEESTRLHDAYVEALIKLLELLPDETEGLQQSLYAFRTRANASTEHDQSDEINTSTDGHVINDPDHLDNDQAGVTANNPLVGGTIHNSTSVQPMLGLPATIKLPPLQITQFSGNLIDWPEFKASCESTYTRVMDETSRFRYLKSNLMGEPARMIKHLPLTAASYDRAWEILKKRYDNERAIINANLARLFALEAPSNQSVDTLKGMLDTANECIAAINSYGINTDSWDAILIFVLSRRLDAKSIQYWEERVQGRHKIPKWSEFAEFLEIRINVLNATKSMVDKPHSSSQKTRVLVATTPANGKKCTVCKMPDHFAFRCPELTAAPVAERVRIVTSKNLCTNCLFSHAVDDCRSKFACRHCNQRHHTLLHSMEQIHNLQLGDSNDTYDPEVILDPEEMQALEMQTEIVTHLNQKRTNVKLATAIIRIEYENQYMLVRALIDGGATANLVSQRVCDALSMLKLPIGVPIIGVCGSVSYNVKRKTQFIIRPRNTKSNFGLKIPALIVPQITSVNDSNTRNEWEHLNGIELSDPDWERGGRVDVLLGSAAHAEILLNGLIKGKSGQPIAQKTELGWMVSGGDGGQEKVVSMFTIQTSNEDLSRDLQRFWESEEIPKKKILTPDEQRAEDFFAETTKRCCDGRIMVKLPFRNENPSFGESKNIAKRRYAYMSKRFTNQPELKRVYDQGIQEYLDLGQMELADESVWPHYYLPHHPVIKESSTTTKVRAVYDASCKTSNGNSLNDQLLIGPTIQSDLFSILLHWRKGRYAITGDIEKMYRQIWLDPEHTEFQRIIWQAPNTFEPKSYRLKTVTFGVASAPFLAIRTLFLIADDVHESEPEMADKIRYQFYVDDFFDSVDTIKEAKHTIKFITTTLSNYGFLLRKWKANEQTILNDLKGHDIDASPSNVFKTLGVQWLPSSDEFLFVPTQFKKNAKDWTKRMILSDISRLFDPLGWLSPCTIMAKIFMQKLWLAKTDWDEKIPSDIETEWIYIRQQFATACEVKIPRWIGLSGDAKHISLQGFCDASEKAIASVVFIRIVNNMEHVSCTLIAAKTKVAPLNKISIPRLELNAAVLLASLMVKVKEALKIPDIQQQAWTDSEIVLHWIASHPSRWKTYIAGRVSDIQDKIPRQFWRHIGSTLNPADCASRGITRIELEKHELWWHGPPFLLKNSDEWPKPVANEPLKSNDLEEKNQHMIATIQIVEPNSVVTRFSSYERLLRFSTHCFRWQKGKNSMRKDISVEEIIQTEMKLIKLVQKEAFEAEIIHLQKKLPISNKSVASSLDPYLDKDGILRVGGRLQRASMTEAEKHPIILPAKHHFVMLLIRHTHEQVMHGGLALTAQKLRQKYWIINNRIAIKSVLHKCTTCFRYKKKLLCQKMGDLPAYRLQEALPFTFVGVDYAGYFEIKSSQRKNAPYVKGYIAVFVCLTTRAIHLEVVSSLSTEHFLKAFKRFISRRGIPSNMFSDNALNFIGADRQIQEALEHALDQADSSLKILLEAKRIRWSTIPARAPHFGGWESSVKLVKHHMKRVLGTVRLCFEDFETVITEIEAIVNSRPLWSIPTRIDEYEALTPGHFLISKALNTLPEADLSHIPTNRLSHYQYLQRLRNEFWRLWSKEYIQTLQIRKKWRDIQPNVRPGQIVLVSEDNEAPSYWSLGRILKVYPGEDGLVRAADVFCRSKTLRRPIHKLSLLPILDNAEVNTGQPNGSTRGSMVRTEPDTST